jgi:hypothetical protein
VNPDLAYYRILCGFDPEYLVVLVMPANYKGPGLLGDRGHIVKAGNHIFSRGERARPRVTALPVM